MRKPKVMILGSTGMLGEVVEKYFKELNQFELCCPDRTDYDATDLESIEKLFSNQFHPFDYVINCVGILNNKTDKDLYVKVNVVFPHYLQYLSKLYYFKLIHISTNCVFADSDMQHNVNEIPNATDLYGQSKYFGEIIDDKNVTIRTSIIGQSQNDSGLLNWFLNSESNVVTGYVNSKWNGVTTLELSKFIFSMINSDVLYKNWLIRRDNYTGNKTHTDVGPPPGIYKNGLIQYSSLKPVTKYELLCMFNEIYNKDRIIIEDKEKRMHTSLLISDVCVDKTIEEQIREFKMWYK